MNFEGEDGEVGIIGYPWKSLIDSVVFGETNVTRDPDGSGLGAD